MKKFLFIALLFLSFFISCKTSDGEHQERVEKNTANSKEVYHAVETGDVTKLDDFISRDAIDHSGETDIKGIDSIKTMLINVHNHFKDPKIDIISRATSEDGLYNFDLVKFTGTTIDGSMGAPTNTKMESLEVYVVRIKDGMNMEHWRFINNRDAVQMMQSMASTKIDPIKK